MSNRQKGKTLAKQVVPEGLEKCGLNTCVHILNPEKMVYLNDNYYCCVTHYREANGIPTYGGIHG